MDFPAAASKTDDVIDDQTHTGHASATTALPLRVLVTGGAGLIGSHLVERLLDRGDAVVVVDDLSTGRRENLPDHAGLSLVHERLTDALPTLGERGPFDEVYHLAAAVGVRLIIDEPIRSIETNVDETAALLRFAGSAGRDGDPARTLIASSSEVYGKSEQEVFSEEDDVVYGPTTRSRWLYAATKAIGEYLAIAHHDKHGLPVVATRFFNTVGPRQTGRYGMVLPNFIEAALRGDALPIHGDGAQMRCFCDVRDVVSVLPRLIATPGCWGRVFNVGSDRPVSIDALADLVITTLGSGSAKTKIPYEHAYAEGFEDLRRRRPDLSRVRDAVGFEPTISLEQTIRDIAASHPVGKVAS